MGKKVAEKKPLTLITDGLQPIMMLSKRRFSLKKPLELSMPET
jgi:hypothetical protein